MEMPKHSEKTEKNNEQNLYDIENAASYTGNKIKKRRKRKPAVLISMSEANEIGFKLPVKKF